MYRARAELPGGVSKLGSSMKTAALAASVLLVAASGASAAQLLGGASLHVSPAVGRPHATFRIEYTEPAGGFVGDIAANVVDLTGPSGAGCLSSESVRQQVAAPGSEVVVRLRPTGGRDWCLGTYRGEVVETIRPRCGPAQVCPMFIGLMPIGHFRFTVRH